MSLKHAILGFLSFKPFSGYDLKKAFDNSVRHFWPANQSQIYRTLSQMTDEGLVEKEIVEREERLDMKIYSITKTGRSELHDWLATPLPEKDTREPFLIQVFFGGHPVADGEHCARLGERAGQARRHARSEFVGAVVQAHGVPVHFGQAQQFERD